LRAIADAVFRTALSRVFRLSRRPQSDDQEYPMQNRFASSVVFLMAVMVSSSPAVAQVFYPTGAANGRTQPSDAQKKASEESKAKLKYDPHDLSGIWMIMGGPGRGSPVMGGTPPPPMTAWGQQQFDAHKPTEADAHASRRVPLALGNDPLRGTCNPEGYPRSLRGGVVEFFPTQGKILQIFGQGNGYGYGVREIFTDGRTIPPDLDARWYGWAVGHWEGDALIVDSTGYDERAWLDGNGDPHSEDMKLHEVYRHPDATTLEIIMTLDDPKAYTKPWVGATQTLKLALPKNLTILYESYCVPSEIESYNEGIGNPAVRDQQGQNSSVSKSNK
jgi:hypothetical protein